MSWKALLWIIAWGVIKYLLDVSTGLVERSIEAVKEAEELQLTNEEKRDYVFNQMVKYMGSTQLPARTLALILELAVNYVKNYLLAEPKTPLSQNNS